eukprot:CAMPEP_0177793150 /NCGR_PEP_ID=MMETSP0491_2-20121128/24916_1 /TAXON_ID=63592 /ORGANISM="Tetraselmis chuii, Strain PLY429" /LENGTH=182 /DNA_ID=CAMNT_0019315635 /DNA_START=57 /DNA_END=602 /DNA_ORIENTATION=-
MSAPVVAAPQQLRRTDVKAYFANERTFLHWLSTSVTLGTISSALAGVVGHSKITSSGTQSTIVQAIATLMVLVSVIIAVVATANFYTRGRFLTLKIDGPYYSRALPVTVTVVLMLAMVMVFIGSILSYTADGSTPSPPLPPFQPPPQPPRACSTPSDAPSSPQPQTKAHRRSCCLCEAAAHW